jgi:tRNA A-37 threonylcarbamoyl transferase component Bud32
MGAATMAYNFEPGRQLGNKYVVLGLLGDGYEGEVYRVREVSTGIDRAAKFFFPNRDPKGKGALRYAHKLHKLRRCPIIIQYHHQDWTQVRKQKVSFMVSEFVEGELLSVFINKCRGKRLPLLESLHILYALTSGVAQMHSVREYHGDIHTDNIMVRRTGIHFDVKLIDFFDLGRYTRARAFDDVCDLVLVLHEMVGGRKHYAKQPQVVKRICCGLKRSLIAKRFRTASELQKHLDTFDWDTGD